MILKVFEGRVPETASYVDGVEVSYDDGGLAMIVEIDSPMDETMFVKLQSWDVTKEHAEASRMLGRKVRVTVEIIED